MAEQQKLDIYLSTARLRNDIEFARKLFSDLSVWDLVVYLDMEDRSGDASIPDQIKEAISSSTIFVPLLSPASARSAILLEETKTAQALGKPIIPVLYRSTPNIPEMLSLFQSIDMREGESYAKGIDQIINAVYRYEKDKNQSTRSQAFGGDIVRIKTSNRIKYENRKKLEEQPFVSGKIKMIADRELEVIVDDATTAIPKLMEVFKGEKLTVETIEQIAPPLEEVLERLIEKENTNEPISESSPDQIEAETNVRPRVEEDPEVEKAKKERVAFERNLLTNNRSQRLYNDRAEGEDQLGIKEEVSALAETLLLRDVEPPVAVGVMGGWGSGKSFVMYLIGKHVEETRAKRVKRGWSKNANEKDPAIPAFVGHIYQIHFNAWTYAKSNLWASLMDTIFINLNRQMQLERLLAYRKFDPDKPPPSAQDVHDSMMDGGDDFKKIYVDNLQVDQDADLKPWRKNLIYWSQHLLKENMLWNVMRGQQVETLDKLKDTEEQLKQLKARREQFEKDRSLNEMTSKALDKPSRQAYFQTLKSVLLAFVSDALSETTKEELKKQGVDEKDIENSLKEVNGLIGALRAIVTTFRTNKIYLIWSITFFAITFILPFIWSRFAQNFIQRNIVMTISGLMTALPVIAPVLMWVRKVINFNMEANKILEGAYVTQQAKYAEEVVNSTDMPLPQKISELQDQISKGSLAAYDALINLLETQAEEQRQWIGPSAKYANLMDFVQSRLDAATYENQLGLMHQVRQDIDELTYSLVDSARPEVFPRGKPRVILYIDDLDRCPPARVIEVLEAIQLLLSTKLFIVILGLDTRYVTRALEKEYKEILQHEGDPSGLDYIEKIIQIPYRVRPIESENLQKYLNAQMDIEAVLAQVNAAPSGSEASAISGVAQGTASVTGNLEASAPQADNQTTGTGEESQSAASHTSEEIELPTAVIQFKQEDLLDLTACCQRVALTPRSIKRLVNVLKLMKIFWFRAVKDTNMAGRDRPRAVKQAAMSLLALSSAYPEVMREAFIHLENLFRLGKGQTALFEALSSVKLPPGTAREIAWQLQKYKGDITTLKAITAEEQAVFGHITLSDLNYSTFNLIRSFSFVGDPIYWSEVEEEKPPLNGRDPVRRITKVNRN
jgi:hypothetical protein